MSSGASSHTAMRRRRTLTWNDSSEVWNRTQPTVAMPVVAASHGKPLTRSRIHITAVARPAARNTQVRIPVSRWRPSKRSADQASQVTAAKAASQRPRRSVRTFHAQAASRTTARINQGAGERCQLTAKSSNSFLRRWLNQTLTQPVALKVPISRPAKLNQSTVHVRGTL